MKIYVNFRFFLQENCNDSLNKQLHNCESFALPEYRLDANTHFAMNRAFIYFALRFISSFPSNIRALLFEMMKMNSLILQMKIMPFSGDWWKWEAHFRVEKKNPETSNCCSILISINMKIEFMSAYSNVILN